jgi:hypothetical protein
MHIVKQSNILIWVSIMSLWCKHKELCELGVSIQSLYASNYVTKINIVSLTSDDNFMTFETGARGELFVNDFVKLSRIFV